MDSSPNEGHNEVFGTCSVHSSHHILNSYMTTFTAYTDLSITPPENNPSPDPLNEPQQEILVHPTTHQQLQDLSVTSDDPPPAINQAPIITQEYIQKLILETKLTREENVKTVKVRAENEKAQAKNDQLQSLDPNSERCIFIRVSHSLTLSGSPVVDA